MNVNYEEMKKEYLLKLEYSKVKPKMHDGYLAMKECNMMYEAYLMYRSKITLELLCNDSEEYASENLLGVCDSLLDLSTLMSTKLIDGFFDFNYSDEKSYSFTDDEIRNLLLNQHFHKNSKDGLGYKISLINRLIIDNTKEIYNSNLDEDGVAKKLLKEFKASVIDLFKKLDNFNN